MTDSRASIGWMVMGSFAFLYLHRRMYSTYCMWHNVSSRSCSKCQVDQIIRMSHMLGSSSSSFCRAVRTIHMVQLSGIISLPSSRRSRVWGIHYTMYSTYSTIQLDTFIRYQVSIRPSYYYATSSLTPPSTLLSLLISTLSSTNTSLSPTATPPASAGT